VIEMTETLLSLKGDTIHHAINHHSRFGRWENLHQFVDRNSMLLVLWFIYTFELNLAILKWRWFNVHNKNAIVNSKLRKKLSMCIATTQLLSSVDANVDSLY
jgi:hypothetical protein